VDVIVSALPKNGATKLTEKGTEESLLSCSSCEENRFLILFFLFTDEENTSQ